jgi:NADH-quinone oxidoreductase subunit E/NADP-reducing hydrogenase subunit HndA
MGTACFVRGSQIIANQFSKELNLKMGETSPDRKFSLEGLRCVGACGLAPVVLVGEDVYGKISVDDVSKIISDHQG